MERRAFIKRSGIAGLSCIGLASFIEGCRSLYEAPNMVVGNKILVKKTDLEKNKYVVLRNEKLQTPICLFKLSDNAYSAVLMLCTHKGCELKVAGNALLCPCHGSEFSETGKVQNPPADTDLPTFRVTTDNENIYIQL